MILGFFFFSSGEAAEETSALAKIELSEIKRPSAFGILGVCEYVSGPYKRERPSLSIWREASIE